jgi:hypothetical protein
MDTSTGPAQYFAGGHRKFDDKGRCVDAPLVIIQWRKGQPVGVRPSGWTVSGCGFDLLLGVLILELYRAEIAERGV